MDLLRPGNLPYVFLAIAVVFAANWLRHRGREDRPIAQRNRVRMVIIFGLVGCLHLLWRQTR